jgi:hypothetical protein
MNKLVIIISAIILALVAMLSAVAFADATPQAPVNYTILNSQAVDFNFSGGVNSTAQNYTYILSIGLSNTTVLANKTMANDSTSHFFNQTVLQIDSGWGLYHNWTIWESVNTATNITNTYRGFFKVDSAVPTFNVPQYAAIGNKTTGGNFINGTVNISDLNPSGCQAALYWSDGTWTNFSTEVVYNTSVNNSRCEVNVTPADIIKDGKADFLIRAKDQAGNINVTPTNQSYVFYRLKAGWNLVTGYENKTVTQIAAEFTNVTYVSLWDNNKKVFWTYTVGGATNASMGANFSSNLSAGAAYVYVNADVVSMRRWYAVPATWQNVSLFHNTSANLTTWNLIGVTKYITDLNATMQRDVCANFSGTNVGANCTNITWVSFWSSSENKMCSFYRGRISTSCSLTADKYNLTSGDALFIAVQAGVNMTLNRNGW